MSSGLRMAMCFVFGFTMTNVVSGGIGVITIVGFCVVFVIAMVLSFRDNSSNP